jgi:hypothetical protein
MHFHGMPPQHGMLKVHRHRPTHPYPGPIPSWPRALSRRQFATTVAGAVVGATLGAGVGRPRLAQARQTPAPVPIPASQEQRADNGICAIKHMPLSATCGWSPILVVSSLAPNSGVPCRSEKRALQDRQ